MAGSGGVTGGRLARFAGHLADGMVRAERSVHVVGNGGDGEIVVRQVTPVPASPDRQPGEPGPGGPLPHFLATLVAHRPNNLGMHGSSLSPGRPFWFPTSSKFAERPPPRHRANALPSPPYRPSAGLSLPAPGLRRLSPGQRG